MSGEITPELELFIIYAEPDTDFVRGHLLPALELRSDQVLLVDELPLGGLMVEEIERGVSRSRYTIAILSPAYLADRWADFGTGLALHAGQRDSRVIPLRLADCELPVRIDARVGLDFRDPARWPWETSRLRTLLGRPSPAGELVPYPTRRRRPWWRRRSSLLASAAAMALPAIAAARWWPDPRPAPLPPPPPEMVRFAAASIQLGVFDTATTPAECRGPLPDEGCPLITSPEAVPSTSVAAFYLDHHEVTNGEYAAWLNAHPELWKLAPYGIVTTRTEPTLPLLRTEQCGGGLTITPEERARVTPESARWPVVCVSWSGAAEYCRAQGKRLPLESEWELAAKGTTGRPFPWGAELPRQDVVAFGLRGTVAAHARAVGTSRLDVSPEGIYDLGGNAVEWVEDGRGDARKRVLRGGGFGGRTACTLLGSRCARFDKDDVNKLEAGFRCARSASSP